MRAILALEDGKTFEGEAFGAEVESSGEVCFNTSMTGYQEVLTDPSYRGQIVTMTYPLIGNYGVNELDGESDGPHVRGFAVAELCEVHSNWRANASLDDYLKEHSIPGITGIDTRALTRHLRTRGAMKGVIMHGDATPEDAVERAKSGDGVVGMDYVKEVTTPETYEWGPDGPLSGAWTIPNPSDPDAPTAGEDGNVFGSVPPVKYRIVAYDFGIKRNMLRRLRQRGFAVHVVNAGTSAADVLALKPDGVFLSNGPGDPSALTYIHDQVRELLGKVPIFAICLGHQVLCHAFGGTTFKLKFGHRGGNQPVKDLRSGKVAITSQNHGFAVDPESLPPEVEVTHINLNDQTVEGMSHREHPVFSVQYHPEAAPGPNDALYFFDEFAELIDQWASKG